MYKRQKNTETEEHLFREKNYLLNEKKSTDSMRKNVYRSWTNKENCNDLHNKSKIINEKMISDTMLIRRGRRGYIIEEYSRGAEYFFNNNDIAGKDILNIKSPISFMNEILQKVMDKSLKGYVSLINISNIQSKKYEFGIILKVEALLPLSSKIIITLHYLASDNSSPEFLYPTQDDFYLKDENDNIIRVYIEERLEIVSTLHSYCKLCNQSNTADNKKMGESERETAKIQINEIVLNKLTSRESEIALLVLEGNTNRFISIKLSISEGTVKKIIHNVYKKLNITSRVELAKQLLKN